MAPVTLQEPPQQAGRRRQAAPAPGESAASSTPTHGDRDQEQGDGSVREPGNGGTPAGSAFALGWAMAQLYGPLPRKQTEPKKHLATINELAPVERLKVAFGEITALAKSFCDCTAEANAARDAWNESDPDPYHDKVRDLHHTFLEALVPSPDQLAAYQFGRALADTWWQPCRKDAGSSDFLEQLNPYRLATLRGWIKEAAGVLPPQSAAIAAQSLQNWQDWADVNSGPLNRSWAARRASVVSALRRQGTAWHALLTAGPGSTTTPIVDAWIQAGESVLRSARVICRRVLTRFWPVVIVALAAIGGLMYLVIANAQGSAKAWSGLVAALSSVGISTAGIKAGAQKVAKGIEQEVWNAATIEARAWEVTWLPTAAEGPILRYRLYRRNVARPQAKRGLEQHGPNHDEE